MTSDITPDTLHMGVGKHGEKVLLPMRDQGFFLDENHLGGKKVKFFLVPILLILEAILESKIVF